MSLRRTLTLATAAGALALSFGAAVATAAADVPVVTIAGPAHGGYHQTVFFSGHTAQPGQRVYLHFRLLEHRQYTVTGPVTSRANTAYTIELPWLLDADYAYYATSNGAATKVHTITVDRASCGVSHAVFSKVPLPAEPGFSAPYASFTATRGGTWAGVASSGTQYAVLRWSSGHPPTVLAHFDYRNVPGDVSVVDITPSGSVLASATDTARGSDTSNGLVWTKTGARHKLAADPSWEAVRPIGVADNGTIFGIASNLNKNGTGTSYLISWANALAPYQILTHIALPFASAYVDNAGDVIYGLADGTARVRLASGQVRQLETPSGYTAYPLEAAGHYLYANDGFAGIVRWDLSIVPGEGPITGSDLAEVPGNVDGAGRDGTIVFNNGSELDQPFIPHHVLTSDGRYADVPARDQRTSVQAVDYQGVVAFTSNADHLPHLLTCA